LLYKKSGGGGIKKNVINPDTQTHRHTDTQTRRHTDIETEGERASERERRGFWGGEGEREVTSLGGGLTHKHTHRHTKGHTHGHTCR
jgi:hypothetical protein